MRRRKPLISADTKRKIKAAFEATKKEAKRTGKELGKLGRKLNRFSGTVGNQVQSSFQVNPGRAQPMPQMMPRRDPYLDLTGKKPRRVMVRRRRSLNDLIM